MDDNTIIELFFARSEQAIRELDSQYGKTFHKLSYNILNSLMECHSAGTAQPAARVRLQDCPKPLPHTLPFGQSGQARRRKLHGGAGGVAGMSGLARLCGGRPGGEGTGSDHRGLLGNSASLIMRRYWFSDSCGEIAARTGLSEKNVSVRLARIRKQLRYYLQEREVLL